VTVSGEPTGIGAVDTTADYGVFLDIRKSVGSARKRFPIKLDGTVKSRNALFIVIPVKAGIRAPGSRRDQGGESPPSGDARSR
jgi:hypothetical protein